MAAMGPGRTREFRRFQAHYLAAFLVVMLADWLQGTNMYTLYSVRYLYVFILVSTHHSSLMLPCCVNLYACSRTRWRSARSS